MHFHWHHDRWNPEFCHILLGCSHTLLKCFGIWQLFSSLAVPNIEDAGHPRPRAYKPRTRLTLLITRCIMAKFRYFKKAKFHYFKQVNLFHTTCLQLVFTSNWGNFWHAFTSRWLVSDSWAFLFKWQLVHWKKLKKTCCRHTCRTVGIPRCSWRHSCPCQTSGTYSLPVRRWSWTLSSTSPTPHLASGVSHCSLCIGQISAEPPSCIRQYSHA